MSNTLPTKDLTVADPLAVMPRNMPNERGMTEPARSLEEVGARLPPVVNATDIAHAVIDSLSPETRAAVEPAALTGKSIMSALRSLRKQLGEIDRMEETSDVGKQRAKVNYVDSARTIVSSFSRRVDECRAELARLSRPASVTAKPDAGTATAMSILVDRLLAMPRVETQETINEAANRLFQGTGDFEDKQLLEVVLGSHRVVREALIGNAPQTAERLRAALDPERAHAAAWCEWAADLAEQNIRHAMHWLDSKRHALGILVQQSSR